MAEGYAAGGDTGHLASDIGSPLLTKETPRPVRGVWAPRLLALAAGLLGGGVLLCWERGAGFPSPQSSSPVLLQAQRCPPAAANGEIPWLDILDGPEPPSRQREWFKRVCVPKYEGPNCSNATVWKGHVTLCLDGQVIPSVHMHTRGHVSAQFPKHQFALNLPSAMSLLGMPKDKKWVLATSFIDTSYQRNPLAFDLYRMLGGWAPSTRYVNVRWHGKDYGLYYIGEKPEVSPSRIHLSAGSSAPSEASFLLTADWKKAGVFAVHTEKTSTFFNVIYPPIQQVSLAEKSFLKQALDKVDQFAAESHESLQDLIDFPSFARYFIVQEIAKDMDGYAFSNYMSFQAGKLYHASPWDFDLGFNFVCMAVYYTNSFTGEVAFGAEGWNIENPRSMGYWFDDYGFGRRVWDFGSNKRQLFLNIWRHPAFIAAFVAAWREARQGPLADASLHYLVRGRAALVASAAARDVAIWKNTERCAFWVCCHPGDGQNSSSANEHLEQYVLSRARWIDAHVGDLLSK